MVQADRQSTATTVARSRLLIISDIFWASRIRPPVELSRTERTPAIAFRNRSNSWVTPKVMRRKFRVSPLARM